MDRDRKIAITVPVAVIMFATLLLLFFHWLGVRVPNNLTNQTTVQSSDKSKGAAGPNTFYWSDPQIMRFQPKEIFFVIERPKPIAFANLPFATMKVRRAGDKAVFRVLVKNYFSEKDYHSFRDTKDGFRSGTEVKLFSVELTGILPLRGNFVLALPLDEAAHYSALLPKNASW